jgi:aspartyl-tRNA(Asn)/glutamyl-tRNA(Gln) amidotransferase subunit B
MSEYTPTIGLEIHAELRTETKMFCTSRNDPDEVRPNVNVCPVCTAHPGTLPVINKQAIMHVLRVGAALGARLADYTEFDRKSYFYPDLPKGYQISQYEHPLVQGGELAGVKVTRVHLEEDTASSVHDEATGETTVDYNRSGVPLMELVTEPVIQSAEQAGEFARELQLLLRALGASEANMEKGEMRVEANVSVGKDGTLGTKVEIKNLNSFNAMERAVLFEIERQKSLLEKGEKVLQETRGWDDARQTTFPQRTKEGSADYRYFPDPDLPSLKLSEVRGMNYDEIRSGLPELPREKRERYVSAGVKPEDADSFVKDERFGVFFDEVARSVPTAALPLASNYIANDLVKIVRDIEARDSILSATIPIEAQNFAELIMLMSEKKVSSRAGKDILARMVAEGGRPETIAQAHDLLQKTDAGLLEGVVRGVMDAHPSVVADYKAGKAAALEFLLGQCMRQLRGAGDPLVLRDMLKKMIGQ